MQEQDHFEEQHSVSRARQAEHILSFQEVVYPPPRWKRVLFSVFRFAWKRFLVATFQFIWQHLLPAMSQFLLGIGVGLTFVWIVFVGAGISQSFFVLLVLLLISIPCMCFRETRFFGFGLLACIFALPVLISIS